MRTQLFLTLGLSAALSLPSHAYDWPLPTSKPAKQSVSPERLDRLHHYIEQSVADRKLAGAVTLVARKGKLVDYQTFGYLDAEKQIPMPKDAIFRLYSMTKPITAVAVMTLVERGLIRLDDPVSRFLPEFKDMKVVVGGTLDKPELVPAKRPITIRHLLSHTSGIPYSSHEGSMAERLSMQAGVEYAPNFSEFTHRIAATPLANQPGEAFQYGFSQDVLGRVIEVMSGMTFDQYLAQTIFIPLNMPDTGFAVPAEKRPRLVPVHTSPRTGQLGILPSNPAPEGQSILAFPAGGEGLYSTGGDYLRFAQMLHNRGRLDGVKLLSPYTVDLMLSDQLVALPGGRMNEGELNYGLGVGLRVDLARGELGTLGQYGWGGYATTDYLADSKADVIWIYLSQHLPPDQNQLIRDMRNLVYGALE